MTHSTGTGRPASGAPSAPGPSSAPVSAAVPPARPDPVAGPASAATPGPAGPAARPDQNAEHRTDHRTGPSPDQDPDHSPDHRTGPSADHRPGPNAPRRPASGAGGGTGGGKASARRVGAALSAHSAIGLTVAALLYILSLSGVLSVFNHELQRWEQPGAPEMAAIDPATVDRAAAAVMAGEPAPTDHFFVQLPTPDMPRVVVTTDNRAVFIRPDGTIAGAEAHPWTQFILDLHYYLHLPHVVGLTLVGALGAMLLGLSLSGLLAHPRIFRDAFAVRLGGSPRLAFADLHNRLAVWTAPFHISSALTGAMLGLASVLAFGIAALWYDGDVEAVYAPIFGDEPAADAAPAPLAAIGAALTHMRAAHGDLLPTYVILHEPATAGQHLQILAEHPRRLIFGDYYAFAADGTPLAPAGLAAGTLGQQIAASAYQVHFGSFGGLWVKIAYGVFGTALAVVIASGVAVYLVRRRSRGRPTARLAAVWSAIVWGTPAALALTMAAALTGPLAGSLPGSPSASQTVSQSGSQASSQTASQTGSQTTSQAGSQTASQQAGSQAASQSDSRAVSQLASQATSQVGYQAGSQTASKQAGSQAASLTASQTDSLPPAGTLPPGALVAVFWGVLAVAVLIAAAVSADPARLSRFLRALTGVSLSVALAGHALTHGAAAAAPAGLPVTAVFAAAAVLFLLPLLRTRAAAPRLPAARLDKPPARPAE